MPIDSGGERHPSLGSAGLSVGFVALLTRAGSATREETGLILSLSATSLLPAAAFAWLLSAATKPR